MNSDLDDVVKKFTDELKKRQLAFVVVVDDGEKVSQNTAGTFNDQLAMLTLAQHVICARKFAGDRVYKEVKEVN